jgi:hypothetical protein
MTEDVSIGDIEVEPEHPERVEEMIGQVDGLDDAMTLVLDRLAVLEMEIDELWDQVHDRR